MILAQNLKNLKQQNPRDTAPLNKAQSFSINRKTVVKTTASNLLLCGQVPRFSREKRLIFTVQRTC